MTYLNIEELKAAVYSDLTAFKLPFEKSNIKDDPFIPKPETFEIVTRYKDSDEKLLVPAESHYSYLFRGQSKEHIPCVPYLYRENPSDVEVFIQRLRLVEFSLLMDTHPIVDGFFKPQNFVVDHKGLAQHYGIKTEVLDFTSNLDIAIFFAICPYDKSRDCYTYIDDNEEHEAILYVIIPAICGKDPNPTNVWGTTIQPIGLQPLMRPGMQRGFGMHLKQNESFSGYIYQFKYTSADSKLYFDKYKQGEKLWTKDDVIDKAHAIINKREFTYRVFNETWRRYSLEAYSKTQIKNMLAEAGVLLSSKYHEEQFSEDEKEIIIKEWEDGKRNAITSNLVYREWYDGKVTEVDAETFRNIPMEPRTEQSKYDDKNWHQYRYLKMIAFEEVLRLFGAVNHPSSGRPINYNDKF